MPSYDITTDIDNEIPFTILFQNGDFVIDEVSEQNVRLALLSNKGNWKQYPLVGAEINKLLHSSIRSNYSQLVSKEMERVGYRVTNFSRGSTDFDSELDFDIDVEEI